jgi:membrane protein involved in colicin uptake
MAEMADKVAAGMKGMAEMAEIAEIAEMAAEMAAEMMAEMAARQDKSAAAAAAAVYASASASTSASTSAFLLAPKWQGHSIRLRIGSSSPSQSAGNKTSADHGDGGNHGLEPVTLVAELNPGGWSAQCRVLPPPVLLQE